MKPQYIQAQDSDIRILCSAQLCWFDLICTYESKRLYGINVSGYVSSE